MPRANHAKGRTDFARALTKVTTEATAAGLIAGRALSVDEVSQLFGVSTATVVAWIAAGELPAVNVSRSARSKRPRWRITPAALQAFELRRGTSAPQQQMRRRKPGNGDVIEFYK